MTDLVKVTPINKSKSGGKLYEYEGEFDRVRTDLVRVDGDDLRLKETGEKVNPKRVSVEVDEEGDGFWWQYEATTKLLVRSDGVYVEAGADIDDAEFRAYHTLRYLAFEVDIVPGWRTVKV